MVENLIDRIFLFHICILIQFIIRKAIENLIHFLDFLITYILKFRVFLSTIAKEISHASGVICVPGLVVPILVFQVIVLVGALDGGTFGIPRAEDGSVDAGNFGLGASSGMQLEKVFVYTWIEAFETWSDHCCWESEKIQRFFGKNLLYLIIDQWELYCTLTQELWLVN